MKRPRAHVIDDRAERLFADLLPDHWIKRRVERDYGVDFEVEIVDSRQVTGKRVWVQLKGFTRLPVKDKLPWRSRGPQAAWTLDKSGMQQPGTDTVSHVRVPVSTKLLDYALRCDFPLLLAAADLDTREVYLLPLRDYIEVVLDAVNPAWGTQKQNTLYIDARRRVSKDLHESLSLLRWYAYDPGRRAALGLLAYFAHELDYEAHLHYCIGDGHVEGEEHLLLETARVVRRYVERAMALDILYGDEGLGLFKMLHIPVFEAALAAASDIEVDVPARNISFDHTASQVFRLHAAVQSIAGAVAAYQPFREAFVLTPLDAPMRSHG